MRIETIKQFKNIRLLETHFGNYETIYTVQERGINTMFDDVMNTTDRQLAYDEYKQRFEDACYGGISFDELNDEMKEELRWNYLGEHQEKENIDDITEEELEEEYGGITFVPEDFSCNL